MAMRDLVSGGAPCAVPGSSSSSNPLGALANALIGTSSNTQERLREIPSSSTSIPEGNLYAGVEDPFATLPGLERKHSLLQGSEFIRGFRAMNEDRFGGVWNEIQGPQYVHQGRGDPINFSLEGPHLRQDFDDLEQTSMSPSDYFPLMGDWIPLSESDFSSSGFSQDSDNGDNKSPPNEHSDNGKRFDEPQDNMVTDETSRSRFPAEFPNVGPEAFLASGFLPSDSVALPYPKMARSHRDGEMEDIIDVYDGHFVNKPANEINARMNKGADKIHVDGSSFPGTCPIPTFDGADKVIVDENRGKHNILDNRLSFAFRPLTESGSPLHTSNEQSNHSLVNVSNTSMSPLDETNEDDVVSQGIGGGNDVEDDGYNWRKYGQKRVKGSKHPRSYYKCTHTNCPVTKKVERSPEGYVVKIIYKEFHTHLPPRPERSRSPGRFKDPTQAELEHGENLALSNIKEENFEDTTRVFDSFPNEEDDASPSHHADEHKSKRRVEDYAPAEATGATRSTRETKVIVQVTSDMDGLDDGYRWRKYGQKTVKGNPNPRSYYKCTAPNCNVRKHVERSARDVKAVLFTYEGRHNHGDNTPRNSAAHGNNSGTQNPVSNRKVASVSGHRMHSRPEPAPWGSFGGLAGLPPLGLSHPLYGFGMNHPPGLAGLGLSQWNGCPPMLPVNNNNNNNNPFLGHQPETDE